MGREISHPPFEVEAKVEVETPRPKRKRRPSITTVFRQVRKAGERGLVSLTLPDGTTITSAGDGTIEQMMSDDETPATLRKLIQ